MGINMNEAFPSKWMKSDDIQGKMRVTIKNVTMEHIGDDDTKPVIWFNEFAKGMVLNKTNAANVSALYGPDSDNWIGKPMDLATAWVDFQGRSTKALRLYAPENFVSGTPSPNAQPSGGDPRGDVPPPASENDYGGLRG